MNIKGKLLTVFLLIIAGSFAYSIGRNHDLREIIEQRFLNERSSIEQEVKCSVPNDISIKDIGYSQFTIFWNDVNASSWEYYVQEEGIGLPSPSGSVKVTKKDNIVKNDNKGVVLKENTNYEIYVRSNCDNGNSDWAGPFFVKTLCKSFAVYPFLETFNSSSVTLDCWTTEGKNNSTNWETTGVALSKVMGLCIFKVMISLTMIG